MDLNDQISGRIAARDEFENLIHDDPRLQFRVSLQEERVAAGQGIRVPAVFDPSTGAYDVKFAQDFGRQGDTYAVHVRTLVPGTTACHRHDVMTACWCCSVTIIV